MFSRLQRCICMKWFASLAPPFSHHSEVARQFNELLSEWGHFTRPSRYITGSKWFYEGRARRKTQWLAHLRTPACAWFPKKWNSISFPKFRMRIILQSRAKKMWCTSRVSDCRSIGSRPRPWQWHRGRGDYGVFQEQRCFNLLFNLLKLLMMTIWHH
jgi:hypothetical protein